MTKLNPTEPYPRAIHLDRYTPPQISVLPVPCLDVGKMTTSRQGNPSTMASGGAGLPRWIAQRITLKFPTGWNTLAVPLVCTWINHLHEWPSIPRQKSSARRALRRAPRSAWTLAAGIYGEATEKGPHNLRIWESHIWITLWDFDFRYGFAILKGLFYLMFRYF